MIKYAAIKDTSRISAVRSLLEKMLSSRLVDAVLVAARTPYSDLPMPTLIADPARVADADPLAPVAPFNAARQAVSLTRHSIGKRLCLVLRPCEYRALIELVKLKQCALDDLVILGIECGGRMENDMYLKRHAEMNELNEGLYTDAELRVDVARACGICEHFMPEGADLSLCRFGVAENSVGVMAQSPVGEALLERLELPAGEEPPQRADIVARRVRVRTAARDALFADVAEKINRIEKFQNLIATCINCYNCRTACPVCYCKECVFLTDVFAHRPETLLRRAVKRGAVKMPTDTTMFHLTRLAHMSHACVGCGQCSSVCPSDIPVADVFRTVAAGTQALFDYLPGRDISEPIPYLVFEEEK